VKPPPIRPTPEPDAASSWPTERARGLSSEEAQRRLKHDGANEVREAKRHPLLALLAKFSAPVPWMLEVTIVLELILRKRIEAIVIGFLLVFNALLSFFQEKRAENALALLRRRLPVGARVLRDGQWKTITARELVPGDTIHMRMGDLVPADLRLDEGQVLLDQSALTGESLPIEAGPGQSAFGGAIVKRGEASGEVVATGARTYFGKTAELVREARAVSHLESIILTIVKYLVAMDAALVAFLLVFSARSGLPFLEMLPFALILLVASVPVALPATFTLATALGSMELASSGVLTTRLSAIEEAAAMDVLCSDKTGTITQNRLAVAALLPYAPCDERELVRLAALASDEATQDPLDLAILQAAREKDPEGYAGERARFIPFDPATKVSEALVSRAGEPYRVIKGAPQAVAARAAARPGWQGDVDGLAAKGYRVLAVAAGKEGSLKLAGLVALEDAPRSDSAGLIQSLRDLGVRVLMVTGDGLATARAVAERVGIRGEACRAESLKQMMADPAAGFAVFAEVFPEDKFELVRALQKAGHVAGMTGDGVNDAPALKQAEVGIAVANATDVAKAAASLVLTTPGLSNIVAAVENSRRIYQRMLTYTLNKIIKTVEIALFLSLGVVLTRSFIITPLLIVLLLFTNDFVTMSIATDTVSFSRQPDRWRIPTLMLTGMCLGGLMLVFSFTVFLLGRDWLGFSLPQLQTLVFLTLVFTGQGTVYLVRERRHFWSSMPSRWMLLGSVLDLIVVGFLASRGILMAAIPARAMVGLLAATVGYLASIDTLKIAIVRRLGYG
jgi:H+-transporting ATPase